MSLFSALKEGKREGGLFDSLAYYLLLLTAFLLPFFVVLSNNVPLLSTKIFLAGVLIILAFGAFAVSRLQSQSLSFPRTLLLAFAWLVPLAYLVSGLFQTHAGTALFGERFQVDSFMFMLLATLALSVTAVVFATKERILSIYLTVLAGGSVLALAQFILFFARDAVVSLGIDLPSVSLLGSLNDLMVFFGLLAVLAVATLTLLPLNSVTRGLLWVTLVVSTFFLAVVNLTTIWWIVGLFALTFLVYSVSIGSLTRNVTERLSFSSLALLVVSALFVLGGDTLSGTVAGWANVGELDVRPSWSTTIDIGRQVYSENMLFGSGPGSFSRVWSEYRPLEVEKTPFWNTNFSFGIGLLPTSFITTGLIGVLAWLVFLGYFLWSGARVLLLERSNERDPVASFLRISAFVGALFLWVVLFVQVPSPVIIVYAFILSGVFIATCRFGAGAVHDVQVEFKENPRLGFIVTLILTLVILGTVAMLYSLSTRYAAEIAHMRAVVIANTTTDIDEAERAVERAIVLHQADVYYRLKATITLVRIQQLLAENAPAEEMRERFQALLSVAIADAKEATVLDPLDYQNWTTLGTVYQSVIPFGIEGAAESAQTAFDRALVLRPQAPALLLAKATIAREQGDTENARSLVEQAISTRSQYTDAIFMLAQMQIESGEIEDAIRSVEAATIFNPRNPVGFFQLGLLYYSTQNWTQAAIAFERAVNINSIYANARYFLGLSYYQLGRSDAALEQFRAVAETNPDNAEVARIIENLAAGGAPFVDPNQPAPVEELDAPPVEEPREGVANPQTTPLAP